MVPWYLKIPIKMVVARVPVPRALLNRLGMFRHGSMIRAEYAYEIVTRHVATAGLDLQGKDVLELGPGDSVGNGIIAHALGARSSVLIDAGDWATRSLPVYQEFVRWLKQTLAPTPRLAAMGEDWTSFEGMLEHFGIRYLTEGLASMQSLPPRSIDYCFSEAVLEHVRVAEFDRTVAEMLRVLRSDGVSSHVIDYKDHLQAGLNNMRFSQGVWESDFFTASGFYTNRLRHCDVLASFRRAGWRVDHDKRESWERPPMDSASLHPSLRRYSEEDLRVREATIVVRPMAVNPA